jgi:hypothetical protein
VVAVLRDETRRFGSEGGRRSGPSAVLLFAVALSACSAGGGREHGGRERYDYEPYGRSRVEPGAVYRHQARERGRLEEEQTGARQELLRRQRRERKELKAAGEWDADDKREQQRERNRQEHRFEQQDRKLLEHQRYERDVYD